jgi:SAM-dependent MidA family methyltransferase
VRRILPEFIDFTSRLPLPDAALPQPGADALAQSRLLVAQIVEEIESSGGWISFARYMELALYTPRLGYYAGGSAKLGASGDFITAPELSPLFSATLARQIAEVLASTGGSVLELGAGSGRLAADLLTALDESNRLPERYWMLDVSSDLRARQQDRLEMLPVHLRQKVEWIDRLPDRFTGVILANEVLDALPVHLIVWHGEAIFERGVTWRDAHLEFQERPLTNGAVFTAAHCIGPSSPYTSEVGLAAPALVRSLAACLERGMLLFIDYGFGESEYYHPQRSAGTLMCHYRHRAHDDPFFVPGLQDITAHVNFSSVASAAIESGLALAGYTTQAHFLINLGITELLARVPADQPSVYLPQAATAMKLLSPAEMGELFKVIALSKGLSDTPTGFVRGDLSRLL